MQDLHHHAPGTAGPLNPSSSGTGDNLLPTKEEGANIEQKKFRGLRPAASFSSSEDETDNHGDEEQNSEGRRRSNMGMHEKHDICKPTNYSTPPPGGLKEALPTRRYSLNFEPLISPGKVFLFLKSERCLPIPRIRDRLWILLPALNFKSMM